MIMPAKAYQALSKEMEEVVQALSKLDKMVGKVNSNPLLYPLIINCKHDISSLFYSERIRSYPQLLENLNQILKGIQNFEKYNRAPSALANKAFFAEMEAFLNQQQISSKECNIIEDTLLLLAGVQPNQMKIPDGIITVRSGNDASRLVFHLAGIS